MRRSKAVALAYGAIFILVVLLLGTLSGCGAPKTQAEQRQSTLDRLRRMADQTQVCVTNDREWDTRVELVDTRSGREHAEIHAPPFQTSCEWTNLQPGDEVHGVIKAVGLRRDVVPPAWQHMMVGRNTMRITIGMDGITPFAHSSRSQ